MLKMLPLLLLLCFTCSLSSINKAQASGCSSGCPPFDITGCCPPDPAAQSVSCTIFGCHVCNGTRGADNQGCQNCAGNCDCIPETFKPCHRCHVKRKHHVHTKHKKTVAVKEKVAEIVIPCCKEPKVFIKPCPILPPPRVRCEIIFPGDLQENLCCEFKRKLITCEPYSCFAPYSQDPSVRTTWEIHGKNAGRCVISSTTENVGLTDRKDNPVPITLTCEYDIIGINALIKRFNDIDKRYYHFTTCERGVGIHNCTMTSKGVPLKKIKFK